RVELAGEFGLKAEHSRLDWRELQRTGFSHPILVLLTNSNVVVLTGGGRGGDDGVVVWDPLHRDGDPLFVPREEFERAWSGDALMITPRRPGNGEASSSASLRMASDIAKKSRLGSRGQTSAEGQGLKILDQ